MRFRAPKKTTWWIAVVVGGLGMLGSSIHIPVVSGLTFALVVVGFVLLVVATRIKGL